MMQGMVHRAICKIYLDEIRPLKKHILVYRDITIKHSVDLTNNLAIANDGPNTKAKRAHINRFKGLLIG